MCGVRKILAMISMQPATVGRVMSVNKGRFGSIRMMMNSLMLWLMKFLIAKHKDIVNGLKSK